MKNNNRRNTASVPASPQNRRKLPKWKLFFHRYEYYFILVLLLATLVLGIILLCRGCSKMQNASDFDGIYYIDDYTAYEFDGKGKGAMCLGETTRYVFDYSVKNGTVSFEYEDKRINDTTYTFTLNGNTITITETNGANSYTMTKK